MGEDVGCLVGEAASQATIDAVLVGLDPSRQIVCAADGRSATAAARAATATAASSRADSGDAAAAVGVGLWACNLDKPGSVQKRVRVSVRGLHGRMGVCGWVSEGEGAGKVRVRERVQARRT